MAARLPRVMAYQLKAAAEADHPNLTAVVDDSDLRRWYFLVANLPGPFAGGEYIFHLKAPNEFPQKPPSFEFLTPNGVFEPGGAICISIGEFHARDAAGKDGAGGWRAALGMIGFAREVVNGMCAPDSLGNGIRIKRQGAADKARLAAASVGHNARNHAGLMAQFQSFAAANPGHAAVSAREMWLAAVGAASADFSRAALGPLSATLARAFGAEAWALLDDSLGLALDVGDRAVLMLLGDRVREALTERETSVRAVLVRALHVRVLWERTRVSPEGPEFSAGEFETLLAELPDVCGGACRESAPAALAQAFARAGPAAFAAVHGDLSRFLRAGDIDEKARLGEAFGVTAGKIVADATPAAKPAATPAAKPAADDDFDDFDDYLNDLLGE